MHPPFTVSSTRVVILCSSALPHHSMPSVREVTMLWETRYWRLWVDKGWESQSGWDRTMRTAVSVDVASGSLSVLGLNEGHNEGRRTRLDVL